MPLHLKKLKAKYLGKPIGSIQKSKFDKDVSKIKELLKLGSVDKNFNVTILKFQRNLEKLKKWLELYQI